MQEPVVNANGMTDDEIYQWMEQKIAAARRLCELVASREFLKEQLAITEAKIEEAAVQSRIDVAREV